MEFTKKLKIDDTIYIAKTDFRTALKCIKINEDETIGDYERALGVLCTMFGKDSINIPDHYEKLLKWAKNYLSCGVEKKQNNETPDMDWEQDMPLIESSFISDHKIDLKKTNMDWQEFYYLLLGLSDSELGNCCILNKVRNIRTRKLSDIEDANEREKLRQAQQFWALKKYKKQATEEQKQSAINFYKQLGLIKEEE